MNICRNFLDCSSGIALLISLALTSFAAAQGNALDGAPAVSLSSPDSVARDSTLVVTLRAENRSRDVKEALVCLVDSATGDTIENWYPILPPQSLDSGTVFWNTKGVLPGKHVLRAILVFPNDSIA